MISMSIKDSIITYATETLGFTDCRFTTPFVKEGLDEYRHWVKQKLFKDMTYLERHLPFKENPELLLKNVKTAIVVSVNYKNTSHARLPQRYKIARYAVGKDYHHVIREKLTQLGEHLKTLSPTSQYYYGVDSRPIAERSLAIQSGIGFRGKNTMLIKPKVGSYFFLGVLLTTLELPSDPLFKASCGSCTRCIDACPTDAISPEGTLSAKRCISYQTIEKKTPMSQKELSHANGWLFGCDICQEVCPFNHAQTPQTTWPDFMPEEGVGFDVFDRHIKAPETLKLPKNTPLYRSRHRVKENFNAVLNINNAAPLLS